MSETIIIATLIFFVAMLYSSVGHGGASGYLAILTFFIFAPQQMSTSALILNLLVAGVAWWAYAQAKHFSFRRVLPFIVFSIPFAFIGGTLHVRPAIYGTLLAVALLFAAYRLATTNSAKDEAAIIHSP